MVKWIFLFERDAPPMAALSLRAYLLNTAPVLRWMPPKVHNNDIHFF